MLSTARAAKAWHTVAHRYAGRLFAFLIARLTPWPSAWPVLAAFDILRLFLGHRLQVQRMLIAGDLQHDAFELGIDSDNQMTQDHFVEAEVAFQRREVFPLGAEVRQ